MDRCFIPITKLTGEKFICDAAVNGIGGAEGPASASWAIVHMRAVWLRRSDNRTIANRALFGHRDSVPGFGV